MVYGCTLAEVAELADALDSESSARNGRGGSNPLFGTFLAKPNFDNSCGTMVAGDSLSGQQFSKIRLAIGGSGQAAGSGQAEL